MKIYIVYKVYYEDKETEFIKAFKSEDDAMEFMTSYIDELEASGVKVSNEDNYFYDVTVSYDEVELQ